MNCQEVRDYLLNADSALPVNKEAADHLQHCPSCRTYAQQLNASLDWLKTQPAPAVPPEVNRRLHSKLFPTKHKTRLVPALTLAVLLAVIAALFTLRPAKQPHYLSANEFNIEYMEYRGAPLTNLQIVINKNFINVFVTSEGGKNHE